MITDIFRPRRPRGHRLAQQDRKFQLIRGGRYYRTPQQARPLTIRESMELLGLIRLHPEDPNSALRTEDGDSRPEGA